MIKKENYIHQLEINAFNDMISNSFFSDEIMEFYKNFEEKMRKPDLLGKTIKVSLHQFKNIYDMAKEISYKLGIDMPDIYVYEDFYYGIESKGAEVPWIEISAKTIEDFTEEELKFLLSRELCSISLKHTYYKTMIDQTLKAMEGANFITGIDTFIKTTKANVYKWYRIINYTCDNFGYLICKDIRVCKNAIIKTILNSSFLAERINIKEYINQAIEIGALNDSVYNFTKADEKVPYGPYRIKNLISYASSRRGLNSIREEF